MSLTDEQQAQAERLHNGIAWVYPDPADAAFWDNFFNGQPTRTAAEEASGITVGGGAGPDYYAPRQAPAPAPSPAPAPAPAGYGGQTFAPASGYDMQVQTIGGAPGPAPTFNEAPGAAPYNSNLIKALRAASPAGYAQGGVSLRQNQPPGASAPMSFGMPTGQMSIQPPVLEIPEYNQNSIYQEVYGRDGSPQELGQTIGMNPADLRTVLSKSYDEWLQSQQQGNQQPTPALPNLTADTGLVGGGN
jgi:hypothetical protein